MCVCALAAGPKAWHFSDLAGSLGGALGGRQRGRGKAGSTSTMCSAAQHIQQLAGPQLSRSSIVLPIPVTFKEEPVD